MKHQQVVPDYSVMIQTSGTVLCLVFSGWVLFRLLQAVFWLPGYLEQNQGKLYEKMENNSNSMKAKISTPKAKAKDSDAEEDDNDGPTSDLETADGETTEKGNDDANEREKEGGGGDIDSSGTKKDN